MDFLLQYGLFALKAFTLVIALLVLVGGVIALSKKPKQKVDVTPLNQEREALTKTLHKLVRGKKLPKDKTKPGEKPALFVLKFQGDIKATQVDTFREEISAILAIATPKDEVVVQIESPGGSVNGYGLAASQLQRLRDKNIPLTVCIDKVAASGGYLMACVANHIVAAPFAIIGSIGVVAQMPNFHRWLKKKDIDIELLTAGEYKRTLTLFAENTEKGRKKFQEELEEIHTSFRQFVLSNRDKLDINQVSTGEHWLAKDALALRLVDQLKTSDDYVLDKLPSYNAFQVTIHTKHSFLARVLKPLTSLLHPWA